MARKVGEEAEGTLRPKQVREIWGQHPTTGAIAAGETETRARDEEDYFLFISIRIKTKPCLYQYTRYHARKSTRLHSSAAWWDLGY